MRNFLSKLLATIKQKERYLLDFEYNKNSWSFTFFRSFEYIFGREVGIRRESSVGWVKVDGQFFISRRFYTLESLLMYSEGILRESMSKFFRELATLKIKQVQFITPEGQIIPVGYSFSIASDSSAKGTAAPSGSFDIPMTVGSGTSRILFGGSFTSDGDNLLLTSFNSVNLTAINKVLKPGSTQETYLQYIVNPSSGTHNYTVTATAGQGRLEGACVSYSGAKQTGVPDASSTNTGTSVTTLATSLTTVADNCWAVLWDNDNWNPVAAGTNSTLLQDNHGPGDTALFDNSGVAPIHPAGSFSMTINTSGSSANLATNMASFAPFVAPTSGMFFSMTT